jgi:hypothetical protein
MSISVGSGADAVTSPIGTNQLALRLQLNFIFNDGSQLVVFDTFCIGPLGN